MCHYLNNSTSLEQQYYSAVLLQYYYSSSIQQTAEGQNQSFSAWKAFNHLT